MTKILDIFCFVSAYVLILVGVIGGKNGTIDRIDSAYFDDGSSEHNSLEDAYEMEESSLDKLFRQTSMQCKCGVGNTNHKIVGGQESAEHAWPWAAALVNSEGSQPRVICGGSLINNRYVLTAAHCLPPIMEDGIENFRFILGDNHIDGGNASNRRVVGLNRIYPHPKYNESTYQYDAALIRLNATIMFNDDVLPICLGQAGRPFRNRLATVCGWGTTFFGGTTVNRLRDTRVKVILNANCSAAYGNDYPITRFNICAKTSGHDTCQGDSGGPMFVNRTTAPDIFKQIGITSFGISCGGEYPGVYTRVQRILVWIKYRTKDASYCGNSFIP